MSNNEIYTASREELFGNVKAVEYFIQVGSFRNVSEAEKLKLKLNELNIKSRNKKKKVKTVIWNRVEIGPFQSSSQVSEVKRKLSKNNIDVLVTKLNH